MKGWIGIYIASDHIPGKNPFIQLKPRYLQYTVTSKVFSLKIRVIGMYTNRLVS